MPEPRSFIVRRDPADPVGDLSGAIVAIGNFDGVHRGHRAVLDEAVRLAREAGRAALAITFEPHPRTFFAPERPVFRLSPEAAKLDLLAAAGLDGAVVMTFDAALAGLEAEIFVRRHLVERLAAAHVCVGYDFHFGRARRGSPAFLREAGRRHGFGVTVVGPLVDALGEAVSSSAVRAALAAGEMDRARALLGHAWFVDALVEHGEKRGRDLGYPTANLRLAEETELRHGIYAVNALVDGVRCEGVASFGRRPTFGDGAPLLEVHLFDFEGDLYGKTMRVEPVAFLRPEVRFSGAEELVAQMDLDAGSARAILAHERINAATS